MRPLPALLECHMRDRPVPFCHQGSHSKSLKGHRQDKCHPFKNTYDCLSGCLTEPQSVRPERVLSTSLHCSLTALFAFYIVRSRGLCSQTAVCMSLSRHLPILMVTLAGTELQHRASPVCRERLQCPPYPHLPLLPTDAMILEFHKILFAPYEDS